MVIDDIQLRLEEKNYHKVAVNVEEIHLYYTARVSQAYILLLYDMDSFREFTSEQCGHIEQQVKEQFKAKNFEEIHLLNLICTKQVGKVKDISLALSHCWIIDTKEHKLILFENQDSEFLDLKASIEDILNPIQINPYVSEDNRYQDNNDKRDRYQKADGYEYGNDFTGNQDGYRKSADARKLRGNAGSSYYRRYPKSHNFTICNTMILLINIMVFLVLEKDGSTMDTEYMLHHGAMFWPFVMDYKEYYRLFTYMFLHFGFRHLANNMIILAFIGDNLERATGKIRYLIIYLGSGVIAGAASMGYNMLQKNNVVAVGASGAIFGVVGSMLYIVIVNRGRLEDISTGQLFLFAILSIYSGFSNQEIDNVAHIAGFISGMLIAALIYRKPKKREGYR